MAGSDYLGFDLGVAVGSSYDRDGFPLVQVDGNGGNDAGLTAFEQHEAYGFRSTPLDPEKTTDAEGNQAVGLGCSVKYALEGGRGHVWLGSDPRVIPKLPTLKKGESMLYAWRGQFIRLHDDGAISVFTTDDGTPDGRSVFLRIAPDELRFEAPWGSIRFDAAGFRVSHSSGARIDLGGIGGIPLVGSYARMQAGSVDMSGTVVTSGAPGVGQNLVYATPLIALLTQILTALSGAPATVGAPIAPALAAQIPGLTALIAAAVSS